MLISSFVQIPSLCPNKIHNEVAVTEIIARLINVINTVDPQILSGLCFLAFGPLIWWSYKLIESAVLVELLAYLQAEF